MIGALEFMMTNLAASFEVVAMIVALGGAIVFYAYDVKAGVIMSFFISILLFAWFYTTGLDYTIPLILAFVFLVLMAFTLYASSTAQRRTGFV